MIERWSDYDVVEWLKVRDRVRVTRNIPVLGLTQGSVGVIHKINYDGKQWPYDVYFVRDGGIVSLSVNDIERLENLAPEPIPTKGYLNELRDRIHQAAVENGWWSDEIASEVVETVGSKRNFGELCALINSEVCEALEEWRHGHDYTEIYYNNDDPKPEGIPTEFADAIIRILDFCGRHDLDIEYAIDLKLKYNATRGYRHGGKKA